MPQNIKRASKMAQQLETVKVYGPCVVNTVPIQLVLKEISPVIVSPGENSIDASWQEAEVRHGLHVPFLYILVLKHPVTISWWWERAGSWGRGSRLEFPHVPHLHLGYSTKWLPHITALMTSPFDVYWVPTMCLVWNIQVTSAWRSGPILAAT